MEKLKPLITHHFWILFLVTLCLPPVAWWLTSADLAVEIQAREDKLNTDYDGISNGTQIPNADWVKGVHDLIGVRKEQNRRALDRLWQAQMGLMAWPPNVRKYMVNCPYRGELEGQRIKEILPDFYRNDYPDEARRVWMLTEPVFEGGVRPDNNAAQKVSFPFDKMPRVPDRKWELLPPTWPEIWNSQEDLWMLSELFKAIQRVNAPTTGIVDSYIKQITLVELFGGTRIAVEELGDPSGNEKSAGKPGIPGMSPDGGYPGGGMTGFPGGGRPGFSGAGAAKGTSIRTKPATFDLSEEFKVFATNTAGRRMSMGPGMGQNPGQAETSGGKEGDSNSNDPNSDDNRYLANVTAYRTRGFRLQVSIHQSQVPELIRELLNSQYPIEIVRFQQMALNPDEPGLPSSAGGNRGMRMATAGIPGAGNPGLPVGKPAGSDAGEGPGFDPSVFAAGAEGAGGDEADTSQVSIQTALKELDLVDLVIVGELYLYNPPIVDGDGVPDEEPAGGADGSTPIDETADPGQPTAPQPGLPGVSPDPETATPDAAPIVPGTVPAVTPPAATE